MNLAFLKEYKTEVWQRTIDPKSKILCIALGYVFLLSVWNHSWPWMILCLILLLTTPFWFAPPEDQTQWLTVACEGEKIWLDKADRDQKIIRFGVGGFLFALLSISLWRHWLFLSVLLIVILSIFKLIFLMFAHNIGQSFLDKK